MNILRNAVILLLCVSSGLGDNLVIKTTKGKVRGIALKSSTGKEVDAWYGIPYAEKPTGDLRFKPTVPAESWKGVLETTSLPNTCVQTIDTLFGDFLGAKMWTPNTPLSEDCLYLNVVVPKPRPENATVMVWIYGGGFYSGSSTLNVYDNKILVSEQNVIVVSMQYRVASLGFLYFGNSEAPGNVGILDQVMALQWVQDNIAAFGGNPEEVTIFGESAGAGCAAHHLLSPLSSHLFKRAIMQSGTATSPWNMQSKETHIERGLFLAKELGCPHDRENIPEVINCLKQANATELVYAEFNIPMNGILDFPFVPVVDGKFVTEDPFVKLSKNDFKKTNILLGANADEGYYFLLYMLTDVFKNEKNITVTYDIFLNSLKKLRIDKTKEEINAIIYEYTNWINPEDIEKNANALDKIVGDQFFTCSVNNFADFYAESGNDVYVYHYLHKSPRHLWPEWSGCLHADEIAIIFGEPLNIDQGYSSDQRGFSSRMMRYWSNFAKTGNPNLPSNVSVCNWPVYKPKERAYINLDNNHCSTSIGGLRPRQCAFWNNYIPKLRSDISACN